MGILTPEDAVVAAAHGEDAVVVSNHGGRAFDGAPATLDVLPDVVAAARRVVILVDGGFRRGSDIVKALALGAHGVLLGRATLYGLAGAGEAGIASALRVLRHKVDRVMGLLGCGSVRDLGMRQVKCGSLLI